MKLRQKLKHGTAKDQNQKSTMTIANAISVTTYKKKTGYREKATNREDATDVTN